MGRRGPKSRANLAELTFWENEWRHFFTGLRDGFPQIAFETMDIRYPKVPEHPLLLQEFNRRPYKPIPTRVLTFKRIFSERKLWNRLLKARAIRQVRRLCRRSRYWPDPERRKKPQALNGFFLARLNEVHEKADLFLLAKLDHHYPCSDRPKSDGKRISFLSRAMAGATMGVRPRTAIDLLGIQNTRHRAETPLNFFGMA